jgi:hypothetical protein
MIQLASPGDRFLPRLHEDSGLRCDEQKQRFIELDVG